MSNITKTFKSGDVLKASELNTVVNAVNDNDSRLTTAEGEIETIDKEINGTFSAEISGKTVTLHNVVLNEIVGSSSGFSLTWYMYGGNRSCSLVYNEGKLRLYGPASFDFDTNPTEFDLNTKYDTLVLTAPELSEGVGDAVDVIYNGESIVKDRDGLKAEVAQLAQTVDGIGVSVVDGELCCTYNV